MHTTPHSPSDSSITTFNQMVANNNQLVRTGLCWVGVNMGLSQWPAELSWTMFDHEQTTVSVLKDLKQSIQDFTEFFCDICRKKYLTMFAGKKYNNVMIFTNVLQKWADEGNSLLKCGLIEPYHAVNVCDWLKTQALFLHCGDGSFFC